MCHHVHVMLSAEDKAAVKELWGWLTSVYAVAVLALVAGVAAKIIGGAWQGQWGRGRQRPMLD